MKPKVTIICITYNHEKFIAEALDSFLMQKTDFPFEVIVGEDCSSDRTTEIVRQYARNYPDIIKPVFQKNNVGPYQNTLSAYKQIQGEYVINNEGDDYFSDPLKLQKQVDFLDSHPEYSICFHPVKVIWEDKSNQDYIFPEPKYRYNKALLTTNELVKSNFIQTNSCMYRWRFKQDKHLLDYFPEDIIPGDWYMHLLHAQTGKIGFLPDVMTVYRSHRGGMWWLASENPEKLHLQYGMKIINFYYNVYKNITQFSEKYFDIFFENFCTIVNAYYKNKRFHELSLINSRYSEFFDLMFANVNSQETRIHKKYTKYKKISKILILINILLILLLVFLVI